MLIYGIFSIPPNIFRKNWKNWRQMGKIQSGGARLTSIDAADVALGEGGDSKSKKRYM